MGEGRGCIKRLDMGGSLTDFNGYSFVWVLFLFLFCGYGSVLQVTLAFVFFFFYRRL
jgi:hypothetical protein